MQKEMFPALLISSGTKPCTATVKVMKLNKSLPTVSAVHPSLSTCKQKLVMNFKPSNIAVTGINPMDYFKIIFIQDFMETSLHTLRFLHQALCLHQRRSWKHHKDSQNLWRFCLKGWADTTPAKAKDFFA